MIEEQAQVVEVNEDSIWVETQRKSACGSCAANQSCGTALLARVLGNKRNKVRILNPEQIKVSVADEVVIGISEQALVRGSLAIYIVPLISLFVFSLLGETMASQLSIGSKDLMMTGFGVFGMVLGFAWVRRFNRVVSTNRDYQPVLLRRLSPAIPIKPLGI